MGTFKVRSTGGIVNELNNPKLIQMRELGKNEEPFILPFDTEISIDGSKVIAESKILDGVSVYERILRNPYQINFSFILRQTKTQFGNYVDWTATGTPAMKFEFPQQVLENFFRNIWKRDAIISVQNTYLNGLEIDQLVIKDFSMLTVLGSTNLVCRLNCLENYVASNAFGESLIINQ